jgi:uncharacterized protein (DUF305 family)
MQRIMVPALVTLSACVASAPRGGERTVASADRVSTATSEGDSFRSSMHRAMARMDQDMNVACTDDPDRDFAAMMIPHHQGAVDMALIELRFGRDERLRRLAQGIIVEQRQEIALMQQILEASAK